MKTSELGLGCWQFGGSFGFWENQARCDSLSVLHWALRNGIRHFDTASSYGNGQSEQITGQQVKRFSASIERKELILSTKIMPKSPSLVEKDLKKSLARLCTDYLDILYLHWPSSAIDMHRILDAMEALRQKGLIRNLGVCNFPLHLLSSLENHPIDYLQIPCSLLWMREAEEQKQFCEQQSIKLVGYSPLGVGLLNGQHLQAPQDLRKNFYVYNKMSYPLFLELHATLERMSKEKQVSIATIALAWAMHQGFDCLLIGARNKTQLQEDVSSSSLLLSEEELSELSFCAKKLSASAPADQDNLFGHRW